MMSSRIEISMILTPSSMLYRDAMCCSWGQGWYSASLDGNVIFNGGSGFGKQADHPFRVPQGESSAGTCSEDHSVVSIELTTDAWPRDTSWKLFNQHGTLVRQEPSFDEAYTTYTTTEICVLNNQCSTFYIYDGFGDGLTAGDGGEYKVFLGSRLIHSGSDFGRGESQLICPSEMTP
jgi:hypothetical protein